MNKFFLFLFFILVIGGLVAAQPIGISDCQGLQDISNDLGAEYVLLNSVDCDNFSFVPIEDFSGVLDGNGFSIVGLHLDFSGVNDVGLFAYTDGATIKGLNLADFYVKGKWGVGGLVGTADNTLIHNVNVFEGFIEGSEEVGGLVGYGSNVEIFNSFSSATVKSSRVGGIIGNAWNSNIEFSSFNGSVIGTSYSTGGIIGRISSTLLNYTKSYGSVGGGSRVGGIAGDLGGGVNIHNSFSYADVFGSHRVGGVTGTGGTITSFIHNSFSAGSATADSELGGFSGQGVGANNSYSVAIVNPPFFYDGSDDGIGGFSGSGSDFNTSFWDYELVPINNTWGWGHNEVGLSTAEMMSLSTFVDAGWDIADVNSHSGELWIIDDGVSYPWLYWPVVGCMDSEAHNFEEDAVIDSGFCLFDVSLGCNDFRASNFDLMANFDDGSCEYEESEEEEEGEEEGEEEHTPRRGGGGGASWPEDTVEEVEEEDEVVIDTGAPLLAIGGGGEIDENILFIGFVIVVLGVSYFVFRPKTKRRKRR